MGAARRWGRLAALAALLAGAAAPGPMRAAGAAGAVVESQAARFRVTTFATGLDHPWGAAFLPDGRLLVTERPGRLRLVGRDGALSAPLAGVPAVVARGQGGLLDVAVAPDFATTGQLLLCYSAAVPGGSLTRLVRARLGAAGLEDVRLLLDADPPQPRGYGQYGCRIAYGADGRIYLSTGDRYDDKMRAQRPGDLAGKVLRLEPDGRPAAGNPFLGRPGVRPEILSLGHRNPQGLAFNPWTGSLWEGEFGPRGGDEVNVIRPGRNYGWPIVTHGIDYDGSRIGEGVSRPDLEEPIRFWVPSVSPSGMAFYDGAAFPGWRGSLFLGALSGQCLVRLTTQGDAVVAEERLLVGGTRFRDVVVGPDGFLYLLTDDSDGRILRLEPA